MRRPVLLTVAVFLIDAIVIAQGQYDEQLRFIQEDLARLRAELDSLKLVRIDNESVHEIERLEEKLEDRMRDIERNINSLARAMAPTVLNPRTTAFINFAARADNKNVFDADGATDISNKPFLRSVELDFRAPVDPYAEAVAVLAVEDEAGRGFHVDLEEAYGVLTRLPVLEEAPLGVKLKVGKFRAPFGVNNRLHMHDLPWTTRPLVVSKYLGTEHGDFFESGFNPIGFDLDFFLPNPIPSTTLEMALGIVRAGDIGLGQPPEPRQPAYVGHLTFSRDWNNEHLLTLGGSGYVERANDAPRLLGIDATYRWSPAEQRQWYSLVLGGELFTGSHTIADSLGEVKQKLFGWFGYAQYQLSYWTYAGVRYDWLKEPHNETLRTTSWSVYLSYYTTEFLRFRLGFQQLTSDALNADRNNIKSIQLEVNFVFGSHPTEPYWVNR